MIMNFDAVACNGHRHQSHFLTQMNLEFDHTLSVFNLYEHDQSPFRTTLTIPEVEELLGFYKTFAKAVGDKEMPRRVFQLSLGQRELEVLSMQGEPMASPLFHAIGKVIDIIRFIREYGERIQEGSYKQADLGFIRLLEALPSPVRHDERAGKRRHSEALKELKKEPEYRRSLLGPQSTEPLNELTGLSSTSGTTEKPKESAFLVPTKGSDEKGVAPAAVPEKPLNLAPTETKVSRRIPRIPRKRNRVADVLANVHVRAQPGCDDLSANAEGLQQSSDLMKKRAAIERFERLRDQLAGKDPEK